MVLNNTRYGIDIDMLIEVLVKELSDYLQWFTKREVWLASNLCRRK